MKKIYFILVLTCSGMLNSMETSAEAPIQEVPAELWVLITSFLTNAHTAQEAMNNIKALAQTDKATQMALQAPIAQQLLTELLVERFQEARGKIEAMLGTKEDQQRKLAKFKEYKKGSAAKKEEIMHDIVQNSRAGMFNYFLDKGFNINGAALLTPLGMAVALNNPKMVEFLIKKGADVNAADSYERTPIFYLAGKSEPEKTQIFNLLIEQKPDLSVIDSEFQTPLINAVLKKDATLVELLLENGADLLQTVKRPGELFGKTASSIALDKAFQDRSSVGIYGILFAQAAKISKQS